jgi:hypothetical protein
MPSPHAPAAPGSWPAARASLCAILASVALAGCSSESEPNDDPFISTLVPASSGGFVEARTSQIVSDGSGPSTVFDDFVLDDDASVNAVAWQGIYCVQQPGSAAPNPTATAFTVRFYTDAAGLPNTGAPIHSSTIALAQADQTFEKNVGDLICGTSLDTEWAFYRYQADLSSAVALSADTKYWISIQAHTPSYAVYFGWRDGTADNNSSLQLFDGDYEEFPVDRAYALLP